MIIVLKTSGKRDEVDSIQIHLFHKKERAEKYCEDATDNPMDEKYWTFAEIVKEGLKYEISRYEYSLDLKPKI